MNFNSDSINVVYCCSDLFAEVCAVSMASLYENNKDLQAINVYIIEDKMTDKSKKRILEMSDKYRRNVKFVAMPDPAIFYQDDRFTIKTLGHTYARMILGDVFPEHVERVISLDSDTMVLESVKELWNWKLDECSIAGVDDCMGKIALQKTQHLPPDTKHCNAGMFLIDISTWRQERWTGLFHDYITGLFDKGISLGGYEEEVINKVLVGKIKLLPPQYNLMTLEQVLSYELILKFRQPLSYYSKEEIEYAKEHPVITHTTNFFYVRKRIFEENSDHPMRKQYEKYRNLTPWKDDAPMTTNPTFKQRLLKNVWHMMPKRMSVFVGSFVRNEIRPLLTKKRDDE